MSSTYVVICLAVPTVFSVSLLQPDKSDVVGAPHIDVSGLCFEGFLGYPGRNVNTSIILNNSSVNLQ